MIKERFYEESAISVHSKKEKKLYLTMLIFSIVLFVIGGFFIFFAYPSISYYLNAEELQRTGRIFYIVLYVVYTLIPLGFGLLFFKLKNRFNVSYDYTFVEDELRITKVFNGKRRKFITKFTGEQMLKIGWCDKPSFEAAVRGLGNGKKAKYMTPNKAPAEEKAFFYIVVHTSLERRVYVIECRPIMLDYLVLAAGRNKLERE